VEHGTAFPVEHGTAFPAEYGTTYTPTTPDRCDMRNDVGTGNDMPPSVDEILLAWELFTRKTFGDLMTARERTTHKRGLTRASILSPTSVCRM
jgi:hypothetical protein